MLTNGPLWRVAQNMHTCGMRQFNSVRVLLCSHTWEPVSSLQVVLSHPLRARRLTAKAREYRIPGPPLCILAQLAAQTKLLLTGHATFVRLTTLAT